MSHHTRHALIHKWLRVLLLVVLLFAVQWLQSTHYHHVSVDEHCVVCQLVSHHPTVGGKDDSHSLTQSWYLILILTLFYSVGRPYSVQLFPYSSRAPPYL